MKLFLGIAIVCTCFVKVQSRSCNACTGINSPCQPKHVTCQDGINSCVTVLTTVNAAGTTKGFVLDCGICNENTSINYGSTSVEVKCCSSDLCNNQNFEAPTPNGLECYTLSAGTGTSNPGIVKCFGIQDRCLKTTVKFEGSFIQIKGCATQSVCKVNDIPQLGMQVSATVNCCDGNLCNTGTALP
ncbi:urokinase plasminogen activator surface receptor-like, partial [Carcharodon carcharias]|uniref:urokinase plasminogen activator surface receptor-like n=1 Tax=Carcharodon carcharias TaxID=13397 RepID=UPI001B7E025C